MAIAGPPQGQAMQPQRQAAPQGNLPRGIRNNNPGNIEDGSFARSLPGYSGSDGRFARFDTPDAGMGAKTQLLGSYINRGFDTPAKIINRWAPPSDNNPTQAYAQYVAQRTGVDVNQRVTPEQIPLIAAAISEFENGTQQGGMGSLRQPEQQADDYSVEDLIQMAGGQASGPMSAQVGTRDNPIDLTKPLMADEASLLRKGAFVRGQNGEVYALPGDAFTDNARSSDEAQGGNVFMRRPNAMDTIGAFSMGAAEQIPGLDEAVNATSAAINGTTFSQAQQAYDLNRDLLNQTDRGARVAGGLAGFVGTLALPGAGLIARGGTAANRALRAGGVGAATSAAFGVGNTDGGAGERATAGVVQGGLGLFGGAALQRGADAFGAAAATARANPTAARQLSQAGVDLTPGQMAGGFLQRLEDGATSVPILGDGIRDARRRGLETFNTTAYNQALEPIGGRVAANGREAARQADDAVTAAYTQALTGVNVPRDAAFDAALTGLYRQNPLPPQMQGEFTALLNNYTQRIGRGVDGQTWKQIDSELAASVRAARNGSANNPAQRLMATKLEQTREAFQGMLERANPTAFAATRQADEAAAGLYRIRDAGQSLGTSARDGIFTPGDLNRAVRNGDSSSGNRQFARGEAMMQGLSDNAAAVLPSTVPDSGTPFRSLMAVGGLGGGATMATGGAALVPAAAAVGGLFGGSAIYGRGMQGLMNRAYRASTPGAARQVLADAQRQAAQTPALQPVYESLQSMLRPLLLDEQTARSRTSRTGSQR